MRKANVRVHIVGLVLSLAATLWFLRATILVGYAADYGIVQADHNHKLFRLASLLCLFAFIAFAISFSVRAIRSRKQLP